MPECDFCGAKHTNPNAPGSCVRYWQNRAFKSEAKWERSRVVLKAAQAEVQARDAMLSVVPIGAYTKDHAVLMIDWINKGAILDAALIETKEFV